MNMIEWSATIWHSGNPIYVISILREHLELINQWIKAMQQGTKSHCSIIPQGVTAEQSLIAPLYRQGVTAEQGLIAPLYHREWQLIKVLLLHYTTGSDRWTRSHCSIIRQGVTAEQGLIAPLYHREWQLIKVLLLHYTTGSESWTRSHCSIYNSGHLYFI